MAEKESKSDNKQEKSGKNFHEHLKTKVPVPVYAIGVAVLLILLLFVIKIPYQAKEKYIDLELQTYKEKVEDTSSPGERVCDNVPSPVRIKNNSTYGRAFGASGFKCYAEFAVENQAPTAGNWTYKYLFNVNGKEFPTDPITYKIDKSPAAKTFKFESDVCKNGDTISGAYELVSGPTTQESCKFVPKMIEVEKTRTATRNVPKERIVTKTESFFQLMLGSNRAEKS